MNTPYLTAKKDIEKSIWPSKRKNGVWRIRTNQELMNLCSEPDTMLEIRKGILRQFEHVERRPEERTAKKVFKNTPAGKSFIGKPRKRWLEDVENDLKEMAGEKQLKVDAAGN